MEQNELTELIERARQGEPDAQDTLVRMAQNRVYYHCKKMLKKEEDAQDATQDVLITVLTSLDKLREPAAFWGWVNGITANRCRHMLSIPHREWQIPEDDEGNSMLNDLEDLDKTLVPEQALDDAETRRMILELVDALPPEQRMAVLFYYYDEMSVRDIAQAMDTSEGTVKSRLNYARRSIKAGVEDYERKGIKLYSVSPILLLVCFLRQDAAACVLDSAAAAQMVGQVTAAAAGGAAAEGAVTAAAGAPSAAAGTATAGGSAGVSVKVIAGVLAGVLAVGGVGAGIAVLSGQDSPPPQPDTSLENVPSSPSQTPEDELPFGQANGFLIVEPQAYEGLPVTLVLGSPNLVALPSTSALTQPSISASGPDEAGYVTYTVTYDTTARSHLGSTDSSASLSCSILAQEYNLYDYYTGRLYLPEGPETGASGETFADGSTVVEHNGEQFELSYEKRWQSSMSTGSWTQSTQPELVQERWIDSAMSVTIVVRAPADYDGVLLGINVTDPADPEKKITEDWDLAADDPSHFRFVRLSDYSA